MADLPELDNHDRPSNPTIAAGAFSINWLQRAIDQMHQEFPWAGIVAEANATTVTALRTTNFAPADYILDVRDGVVMDLGGATKRLIRRSFQEILTLQTIHDQGGAPAVGQPQNYCMMGRQLQLDITPDIGYSTRLSYYQMPAVLSGTDIPNFPSDHVLVDYVYLRALEWARRIPQGSAMKYLREVEVAALKAAGLGQEPEGNLIPLDPTRFRGTMRTPWDWLGSSRPNL